MSVVVFFYLDLVLVGRFLFWKTHVLYLVIKVQIQNMVHEISIQLGVHPVWIKTLESWANQP